MSAENVEEIRRGYAEFAQGAGFEDDGATGDFVWDMSHFGGWLEQPLYEGSAGARQFLSEWTGAWDDWQMDVQELRDAGEQVVAVLRQRGRSKATGLEVDMTFAQVWTMRDGKRARMEMYSDPAEALRAVGLAGGEDA